MVNTNHSTRVRGYATSPTSYLQFPGHKCWFSISAFLRLLLKTVLACALPSLRINDSCFKARLCVSAHVLCASMREGWDKSRSLFNLAIIFYCNKKYENKDNICWMTMGQILAEEHHVKLSWPCNTVCLFIQYFHSTHSIKMVKLWKRQRARVAGSWIEMRQPKLCCSY